MSTSHSSPPLLALAFAVTLTAFAPCVRAADPIDVGGRRQVVWDDALLESHSGITFAMNPAVRTGEALLVADKPWENWMTGVYGTVIRDNGLFRMWYSARATISREFLAYAESVDGIHWSKPELGLVNFNGSKANDLLTQETYRPHGESVWIDPNAKPEGRYKFLYSQYAVNGDPDPAHGHPFLTQSLSPDGIHFTPSDHSILTARHGEQGMAFDVQSQCFWDESIHKYVLYTRRYGRTLARAVSDDPMNFPLPEVVLKSDHPVDYDLYCPNVIRYGEADHAYVALVPIFFHPKSEDGKAPADGQPMMKFIYNKKPMEVEPPDSLDVHLFTSHDGIKWERQGNHRPVIGLGTTDSFDPVQIYPYNGYVRVGDELWVYYVGFVASHSGGLPFTKQGTVSRAVFRLDGFMSADAGDEGATLVTKPLKFAGGALELNVNCGAEGHLDLSILDEQGKPIEGFAADRVYYNQIHKRLTFKPGAALASLAGKPIRLQIKMQNARLYAFQFLP